MANPPITDQYSEKEMQRCFAALGWSATRRNPNEAWEA
jgi:hypothetical protein